MVRSLALRLLGLVVAVVTLLLAAQFLILGVQGNRVGRGLLDQEAADDTTRWISRTHSEGAEVLVGVGLIVLAGWFAWAFASTVSSSRPAFTTRRDGGRTRIDRRALARSVQRSLEARLPAIECSVHVNRKGRIDVTAVTTDEYPDALVDTVQVELDDIVRDRGLPCTVRRIRLRRPRRRSHPSRVR